MTCDHEWPWRRTPRLAGLPAVLAQIIRRAAPRPQPPPGRRLPCRCAPGKASWAPGPRRCCPRSTRCRKEGTVTPRTSPLVLYLTIKCPSEPGLHRVFRVHWGDPDQPLLPTGSGPGRSRRPADGLTQICSWVSRKFVVGAETESGRGVSGPFLPSALWEVRREGASALAAWRPFQLH